MRYQKEGTQIYEFYSAIKQRAVEWLWYPYIPYGKIPVLQGDPGEGKSTFALNIAALLTQGKAMPDGFMCDRPQVVMYQCAEDNPADTIKPRLVAAGANCDTIGISKNVVRLLGLPSHVCLMVHADGSKIMIAPCEANDVMSFKVPEKLFTDHSCTFRLNSKQFVHSMMMANGMEPELSYIVPGSYNEKQNVACFDLKEHRLCEHRRGQRQQ